MVVVGEFAGFMNVVWVCTGKNEKGEEKDEEGGSH